MTLAVAPLGGEDKLISIFKRYSIYALSSIISGGLTGFILTTIIFLTSFWIPSIIKMYILIVLGGLFALHEFRIITLKIPECKWQIPSAWLNRSTTQNMWIWGFILGAGIFTFAPFTSFHMLYAYIGLIKQPYYGVIFGMIYAFSRTVPTLFITILRNTKKLNDLYLIESIRKTKKMVHIINGSIIIIVIIYLIIHTSLLFEAK